MGMGRPPKPTELAKLQGNPGKRALPDDQPIPPKGDILPPPRLKGQAKTYFVAFAAMLSAYRPALAYPADSQILARYCECLVRHERLIAWRDQIESARPAKSAPGLVYTMRSRDKKSITAMAEMPQAKEIERLQDRLEYMEEQLGMTPKTRATMRIRAVTATGAVQPDKPKTASHWVKGDPVLARIGAQRA